jgi:hypothetical protein
MITSTIKRVCDAGVCEEGRVDSYAAAAREGLKDTDEITAQWCLKNCGVPGTLWAMGHVDAKSKAESERALARWLTSTALRFESPYPGTQAILSALLRGIQMNLGPAREKLRKASADQSMDAGHRARALLFYRALDGKAPLHERCIEVAEQAILAAAHADGHAVASTEAYRAEYRAQYSNLQFILDNP